MYSQTFFFFLFFFVGANLQVWPPRPPDPVDQHVRHALFFFFFSCVYLTSLIAIGSKLGIASKLVDPTDCTNKVWLLSIEESELFFFFFGVPRPTRD